MADSLGTPAALAAGLRITELVSRHAAHRPNAPAVEDRWGSATYAELQAAVEATAVALRCGGVAPGATVALPLDPSVAYVGFILAALLTGAVVAPVSTRLTNAEIAAYYDRLAPTHAIVGHEGRAAVDDATTFVAADATAVAPLAERLVLRGAGRWGVASLDDLGRHDPTGPAVAFATGGTTGAPKAAIWSHAGLTLAALSSCWNLDVHATDAELYFAPFSHVTVVPGFLATLCAGGLVRIEDRIDADRLAAGLRSGRFNRMIVTPTVLTRVLDRLRASGLGPGSERLAPKITFGAARSSPDLAREVLDVLPGAVLWSGYGATEFGAVVRLFPADVQSDQDRGVGRPVAGVHVRIVDPGGDDVAPGATGEIAVASPWQMLGYRGPGGTPADADRLTDGSIRSGDLGALDGDGCLHLHGRSKEMIKSGGENVFPVEVEQVLLTHPAVVDVGIVGVPDDEWGERVEAFVVAAAGVSASPDDLRRYTRARLSGFKVPKAFHLVEGLPYTATMKLDRAQLEVLGRSHAAG